MSQYDLDKVNAERRRKGLPALTRSQAAAAASRYDSGIDMTPILVALMISSSMQLSYSAPDPSPSPSYDSGSSYSGGFDGGGSFDGGGGSF